jgi:hypothetical protein
LRNPIQLIANKDSHLLLLLTLQHNTAPCLRENFAFCIYVHVTKP